MHIKITVSYHLKPVKMAIIKKKTINVSDNMEKLELCTLMGRKNGAAAMENSMEVLQSTKI